MPDRFELIERIGKGGMGVVWKAIDRDSGEKVALKVLHSQYAEEKEYVTRFEREVEISRRIDSLHVVKVLGFGKQDGIPYMAMEFVDGRSLRDLIVQRGKLSWEEAKPIYTQVVEGLTAAHRVGVIHRDLKPSNILIGAGGIVKLADFGIARASDLTALTGGATMLGTPYYMAPEDGYSAQSDIYSVGCVLYEMLVGAPPFVGDSTYEVIRKHMRDAPDISVVPDPPRQMVGAMLQKDPAVRPHSAAALIAERFDASLADSWHPVAQPVGIARSIPSAGIVSPPQLEPRLPGKMPERRFGVTDEERPRRSYSRLRVLMGAVGLLGMIAVGIVLLAWGGTGQESTSAKAEAGAFVASSPTAVSPGVGDNSPIAATASPKGGSGLATGETATSGSSSPGGPATSAGPSDARSGRPNSGTPTNTPTPTFTPTARPTSTSTPVPEVNGFRQMPGQATDISSGADGSIWITTRTPESDGGRFTIAKWNGSGWTTIGGNALRISVAGNGSAWVVNQNGYIYAYQSGGWVLMPGGATDVGAGADGSIWITTLTPETGGGRYSIAKWTGSFWQQIDGNALSVSVGPDGTPWVVNEGGYVYHHQSTWALLSPQPIAMKDIAVSPSGAMYTVGTNNTIYRLDSSGYNPIASGYTAVAVSTSGQIWAVDGSGNIWRRG